MTLFKIENIDPTKRVHTEPQVACRWILSAINEYEPLIPCPRIKKRILRIKEVIAETVADNEVRDLHTLNHRIASTMIINLYNVAYPRAGFRYQTDLQSALSSANKYLKAIMYHLHADDDSYKYKF